MRSRGSRNRGVFFITTLIVSAVVAMMMTAALALLPSSQAMTSSVDHDSAACAAAQAGLEYARTQLQQDPAWRAEANAIVVDLPGELWIREDRGNVVGILWTPTGTRSIFRMRFNYQNGTNLPDDELEDPTPEMLIPHAFVSYNFLDKNVSGPLWRADAENFVLEDGAATIGDVPRHTAVLYCQGLSGPGVRDVSPSQLQPDFDDGPTTMRILESFMARDISEYGDSVAYGAEDISFDLLGKARISSEDPNVPPRLRSLSNIALKSYDSSPLEMRNGEAFVKKRTGQFLVNGANSSSPTATREDSSASFVRMGWSELDQPLPTDATMKAGTYVWRRSPRRLEYYARDYNPAVGIVGSPSAVYTTANADRIASVVGAVSIVPSDLELRISRNVSVVPQGSITGLAIVPEPGLVSVIRKRPNNSLMPATEDSPAPIVSARGDIKLEGTLQGKGSVTSLGSIAIQGSSVMESDPDGKVALFAKEDISIDAVPDVIAAALEVAVGGGSEALPFFEDEIPSLGPVNSKDVGFRGVVYAQGNVNINLESGGHRGHLYMRGVLVAYGGDYEPVEGLRNPPGSTGGKGYVNIIADSIDFHYDSSYINHLKDQSSGIELKVISWRSF